MRSLWHFARALWVRLCPSWLAPKPRPAYRARLTYHRAECGVCGRVVAVRADGQPHAGRHRCAPPLEILHVAGRDHVEGTLPACGTCRMPKDACECGRYGEVA